MLGAKPLVFTLKNIFKKNNLTITNVLLYKNVNETPWNICLYASLRFNISNSMFLRIDTTRAIEQNFSMTIPTQGGGGHWAVYYTSPQSCIITTFGTFINVLITWFIKLSVQTTNCNLQNV